MNTLALQNRLGLTRNVGKTTSFFFQTAKPDEVRLVLLEQRWQTAAAATRTRVLVVSTGHNKEGHRSEMPWKNEEERKTRGWGRTRGGGGSRGSTRSQIEKLLSPNSRTTQQTEKKKRFSYLQCVQICSAWMHLKKYSEYLPAGSDKFIIFTVSSHILPWMHVRKLLA